MLHRTAVLALAASFVLLADARAQSLDLPNSEYGISLGNSRVFNGLRINWQDRHVVRVTGFNFTVWSPGRNPRARYEGIIIGLGGNRGRNIDGAYFSLIGLGDPAMRGIACSPIGFGTANFTGMGVAGLGIGAEDMTGIFAAGLGMGGNDMTGIFTAGLGMGGNDMTGIFAAGLGMGGDDMTGIFAAGLGMGGDDMTGIFAAGLGMGGSEFRGVGITPGAIRAIEMEGLLLCGAYLQGEVMTGLGTGAWTRISDRVNGVTLGLFNYARHLNGLQLGLLNYAGNNPAGLRLLPLVNAHFD